MGTKMKTLNLDADAAFLRGIEMADDILFDHYVAALREQPGQGVRAALGEKATGLWSLSVTDAVTGLRELSGYPQPTGARRTWPWKVGIQPGRIRPAPSRTTFPTHTFHRNPASPGPVSDGCYRFTTWTRLEPPWS